MIIHFQNKQLHLPTRLVGYVMDLDEHYTEYSEIVIIFSMIDEKKIKPLVKNINKFNIKNLTLLA